MDFSLSTSAVVPAPPEEVFDLVTDIDRLPEWNREIPKVVESPAEMVVGAEWVVTIRAMKTRWNSRSRALEVDRERGRFAYRSQSDDGNPSFADWRWRFDPDPASGGTRVTVEADVHPRTFLRRRLLSELRRSGLRKAVDRSLVVLAEHLAMRPASGPTDDGPALEAQRTNGGRST